MLLIITYIHEIVFAAITQFRCSFLRISQNYKLSQRFPLCYACINISSLPCIHYNKRPLYLRVKMHFSCIICQHNANMHVKMLYFASLKYSVLYFLSLGQYCYANWYFCRQHYSNKRRVRDATLKGEGGVNSPSGRTYRVELNDGFVTIREVTDIYNC